MAVIPGGCRSFLLYLALTKVIDYSTTFFTAYTFKVLSSVIIENHVLCKRVACSSKTNILSAYYFL